MFTEFFQLSRKVKGATAIAIVLFCSFTLVQSLSLSDYSSNRGICCHWPKSKRTLPEDCASPVSATKWCSQSESNCENSCKGYWLPLQDQSTNSQPEEEESKPNLFVAPPNPPASKSSTSNKAVCCWPQSASSISECKNIAGVASSNEWCGQQQSNCEGACNGAWVSMKNIINIGSNEQPSSDRNNDAAYEIGYNDPIAVETSNNDNNGGGNEQRDFDSVTDWSASDMQMTHYWDCNGQSCDSSTLNPWDQSKYRSSPGYAPVDPNSLGGSIYGEKLWVTGAANDALSKYLGVSDGCCGRSEQGGCGKCLLVQNPSAVNADWTVLVMKKNRCPPWANGCDSNSHHFDIAAPGFDNLQYSTANICGQSKTGFGSQQQSAVVGGWWNSHSNTKDAKYLCDQIDDSRLRQGCKLFAEWGWQSGAPSGIRFKPVACPARFKEHIGSQFGSKGSTY